MTGLEAKKAISKEFMEKYYEFVEDVRTKPENDRDFAWKYGYVLTANIKDRFGKDNQTNLVFFQKYIFSGRWLPEWEKIGYAKEIIWQLHRDGFLSYQMYSNWNARASGKTNFYYISQKTAIEIYKDYKTARITVAKHFAE